MSWPPSPLTAAQQEQLPKPPRFVLSEEPCLVHGDPFRASGCERVRGLLCPYCEKGKKAITPDRRNPVPVGYSGIPEEVVNPNTRMRLFERTNVTWRVLEPTGGHSTGEALAWVEVS